MSSQKGKVKKRTTTSGSSSSSFGKRPGQPTSKPRPQSSVRNQAIKGRSNKPPLGSKSQPPSRYRPPSSTGQQATAEISQQVTSLQNEVTSMQEKVRLSGARDSVEDIQTTVNSMDQRIANLRQNGYVFEKQLENQVTDLMDQWVDLYPSVKAQIDSQSQTLLNNMRGVEAQMHQLNNQRSNLNIAQSLVGTVENKVNSLKGQITAAESTISGMYDQFSQQVNQLKYHLDGIEWMLTELAEASFQLLPTEAGIAAVKAVYYKGGKEKKDDPEGILFTTDQRLIFERKEDVTTKKVLFVATEKEKVQDVLLDVPVAMMTKIETSKKGLMKNEDHIEIHFTTEAPVMAAKFHIWKPCDEWQALLNKVKMKEFDKDRAIEIDQAAVAKIKSVPSQCPSCGGNIDQVILRGQDNVQCEFCGFVIRL